METTFGDVKFSGVARKLLNRIQTKQLTSVEFLAECGYWALKDGFDELIPHQYPSEPTTTSFREFRILSQDKRRRLDNKFYDDNPEINKHYAQRLYIYFKNKHTLEWLKEIKSYIPGEDLPNHQKLDERILQFEIGKDAEIENIKNIFNGEEVDA